MGRDLTIYTISKQGLYVYLIVHLNIWWYNNIALVLPCHHFCVSWGSFCIYDVSDTKNRLLLWESSCSQYYTIKQWSLVNTSHKVESLINVQYKLRNCWIKFASPELQSQMFFVFLKGPGFSRDCLKTVNESGRSLREIV